MEIILEVHSETKVAMITMTKREAMKVCHSILEAVTKADPLEYNRIDLVIAYGNRKPYFHAEAVKDDGEAKSTPGDTTGEAQQVATGILPEDEARTRGETP